MSRDDHLVTGRTGEPRQRQQRFDMPPATDETDRHEHHNSLAQQRLGLNRPTLCEVRLQKSVLAAGVALVLAVLVLAGCGDSDTSSGTERPADGWAGSFDLGGSTTVDGWAISVEGPPTEYTLSANDRHHPAGRKFPPAAGNHFVAVAWTMRNDAKSTRDAGPFVFGGCLVLVDATGADYRGQRLVGAMTMIPPLVAPGATDGWSMTYEVPLTATGWSYAVLRPPTKEWTPGQGEIC